MRPQLIARFIAVLFLFVFITGNAQEQQTVPEVGITEQLDKTIPMDLKFLDENGNSVVLGDLIKKPVILTPVYFDCPGICVQLLSGVNDVVEKMDMQLGKDYDIVTFSFNSEDSPEKALDKKKTVLGTRALSGAQNWHFLTGDSTSIYTLTNSLGYYFKRAGNDFVHPASIVILSPEGKITRYLYGVTYLPFDTKMALIEAQKGQSRPSINRILDYCYSYDPAGRKYSLEVTKVSATIIIFLALMLLGFLLITSRRRKKNSSAEINQTDKA